MTGPRGPPMLLPLLALLLAMLGLTAAATTATTSLHEGSPCRLADGSRGQCVEMAQCPSALAEFRRDRRAFRPKRCGFKGFSEVVCCADVPLRRAEEACRDFTNEINPGINPYIYGGEEAQPGEFPHMVGTVGGGDLAEPFDVPEDQPLLFRALPQRGRPIARQPPPPEGRARPLMLRGLDEYARGARDEDVRSRARLARQSRTEFRQTSPSRDRESFGAFEEETTSRPRLVRVTNTSVWEGKAGGRPGNWRVPPDSVWARPPQGPTAAAGPAGAPGLGATQADQPKQPDGKAGIALYVIGGNEAFDGEFKHMVALGFRDSADPDGPVRWDCGGTLISNEHVLTAAHCVSNPSRGRPVRVRVGAHNLTEPDGEQRAVLGVTVHPRYSARSHYHDLAVLRVEAVRFSDRVQPACLYPRARAPDSGMVATGWGVTDVDQLDQTSDVLMKAGMDQVPLSRCNASFSRALSSRLARGVTPDQLCARGSNGVADTCLGDSGGPLQVLERPLGLYSIVGVTSFGQLCGGLGVYVRVHSYLDWIEDVVWPS